MSLPLGVGAVSRYNKDRIFLQERGSKVGDTA